MIIYYRFYLIGVCWCELVKFGRKFGKNIFKLELILLCQLGGGDNGWKKTAIITVFVVLLWILPIYAMDSGNTTTNLSVNSTGHHNQTLNDSSGDQDLHNQIMVLKSAPSEKYKDEGFTSKNTANTGRNALATPEKRNCAFGQILPGTGNPVLRTGKSDAQYNQRVRD